MGWPSLTQLVGDLIKEHGSASILRDHLALIKDVADILEKQCKQTQKENTKLKAKVRDLESKLAAKARADEFVEARGGLFKRKPGGGYHLAVYCPSCHGPMLSMGRLPYQCLKCKTGLDFGKRNLETVMAELPNP